MSYGSFALRAAPQPDARQAPQNYIDLWEERDLADTEQRDGSVGLGAELCSELSAQGKAADPLSLKVQGLTA